MCAQVIVLLAAWGRWSSVQAGKSIGYASVSPMFRDAPSGKGHGSSIPAGVGLGLGNEEIEAVDAAIKRLPGVLRLVVIEVYQYKRSLRQAGEQMGVSHHSAGKYLADAEKRVDYDLSVQRCVIDNLGM